MTRMLGNEIATRLLALAMTRLLVNEIATRPAALALTGFAMIGILLKLLPQSN